MPPARGPSGPLNPAAVRDCSTSKRCEMSLRNAGRRSRAGEHARRIAQQVLETGDGKPFAAVGWREVLTKRVQDRTTLIVGQTVDDQPFVGRDLLLRPAPL